MTKLFAGICMFWLFFFSWVNVYAQAQPQMADVMRSNGKIYVVVGCCLIILTGLFLYVWRVDKKISRIEKEKNNFTS